ncbi:MAG TPA: hypothetical protein VFU73_13240 [Actinocrinis sp.]|nr:hypothetical protein [Actinocrinis sp.]
MTGLIVVFAVLAVASAFGLWRRRVDGRVREVSGTPHGMRMHLPVGF